MKENVFKNQFPSINLENIDFENINKDSMDKFIEEQEKDPNSHVSKANELRRMLSEKSEKELRDIEIAKKLEKITKSNDEILLISKKSYEFLKVMQIQFELQNDKHDEFNESIQNLALQLKHINEESGKSKTKSLSSFFKKINGEVAIAVIFFYVENYLQSKI